MTTELVTAHAGKNHVGSEDVGALYAGALGSGRFALDVGEGLAVTMTDANTIRIGTGVFLMDGRQVRVKEAESVKVANGSQGAFRKDLVVYTYRRDPSNGNVEEGAWSVLQGTAATREEEAKAPDYAVGNILDGDLTATVAVAEVSLSGLTPTARLLLPSVASLRKLGDSVSRDLLHRPTYALTATVPGWHGDAIVTTNQFNDETDRWEYDRGSFFQLRLWLWSYDLSDEPWTNAVQPPNNPFGADVWCAKVPIRVTDGSFEEVVKNAALILVADSSGYLTFQRTYTGHVFLARDGYPYVFVGTKDIFAHAAGSVRVDTTVFNPRVNS